MSRIDRLFWQWNPEFNSLDISLGETIQELEQKYEIRYFEEDANLWGDVVGYGIRIRLEDEQVVSIFMREDLYTFPEKIWQLNLEDFTSEMNNYLTQVTEEYEGDVLRIVFRDYFVTNVGVLRRRLDGSASN